MNFAPQSKVWIYQSDKVFSAADLDFLNQTLTQFTESWTAHNQQLKATYELKYNRFIVLIVDESLAGASGCSIDKSVHLMKEIEQQLGINLFDRFKITYKKEGQVQLVSKTDFENLVTQGEITKETVVFNNLVKNLDEYKNNWETAFANSWHARVF